MRTKKNLFLTIAALITLVFLLVAVIFLDKSFSVNELTEDSAAPPERNDNQIIDALNYVLVDGSICYIKAKYNENEDLVIKIAPGGGNGLPDIRSVYTVNNKEDLNAELSMSRVLVSNANTTDIIGPHVVGAVNNADGDNPDASSYFTGGNHQSNNKGVGGAITARYDSLMVLCDGEVVNEAMFGDEIIVSWSNYIQGYNTSKSDGSGREILQEEVKLTFSGTSISVDIKHTALEDTIRKVYYGLQMISSSYDNLEYIGSESNKVYAYNVSSNCGNKSCRKMRFTNSKLDVLEMGIDNVGLGDFKNNNCSYNAFNMTYGKSYFNLIYNTQYRQNKSEHTTVSGYYKFTSGAEN